MAGLHDVDDGFDEESELESEMGSSTSSDICDLQSLTQEPEVVKTTPQPSIKRQRKPTTKFLESCVSADVVKDCKTKTAKKVAACQQLASVSTQQTTALRMTSSTAKKERLLMKEWLIMIADSKQLKNVHWYDDEHTMIRIPWKHGSRSGWTQEDCYPYKAWAMYTGKHRATNDDEPKRWKANFRCALNSLPDVEEVKNLSQSRGTEPYKVFKLCPTKTRKGSCVKKARKPRRSKALEQTSPKQREQKQQRQLQSIPVTVNTKTAKSTAVIIDRSSSFVHQTSAPVKQLMSPDRTTLPVLPLPVAVVQMAMTSVNSSAGDEDVANSTLITSSYSGVIPTTVEEMSCDDDSAGSDVDYDDYVADDCRFIETNSAVEHLLRQTNSSPSSRQRSMRSDRSSVSESSSGYFTDRVGSPTDIDSQLENLAKFDLTAWCESEDNNALPVFDNDPEMVTEETHGYALYLQSPVEELQSVPFFPTSNYVYLPQAEMLSLATPFSSLIS